MISMAQFVKLVPENLKALREVNPRLMSYNVEFAEVTGGTFWKPKPPVPVVPKLVRRDSNSGMPSAHRMTISRSVMAR